MKVFIKVRHVDGLDFHEWVNLTGKRERIDAIGRRMTRGWDLNNASVWECNNMDCPALAYIPDSEIKVVLNEADQGSNE